MVRHGTCALLLGLGLLLVVPAGPTLAQSSGQDKVLARRMVKKGQLAVKQRRFAEALRHFKAAYRRWPRREIRFNIALVYHQMGKRLDAHRELRAYLEKASSTERQLLPPFFKRLLRELGVLAVTVTPASVIIRINGNYGGLGAVTRSITPGRHLVTFHRDGVEIGRKELDVEGGGTTTWQHRVRVSRQPPPIRRPPPTRRPTDSSTPRGKVHWAWFAAATGATAIAGGVMIWLGLETNDLEERFQVAPTPALQSEGRRYRAATNVMVGLTSAAAITAVVLAFYTQWKGRERPEAAVTPVVSPGGAGLVVRW